jgi:flagellar motor switch protein FliG
MRPELSDPGALHPRRKAAIVVQALLAAGDRPPLSALPDAAQVELAREMGRLAVVDRATLHAVAAELADRIEGVGVAGPRGMAGALAALGTHISPEVAARLRAEAGRLTGDPWSLVGQLAPERLAAILLAESVEVAAVILSKLPVARAAETLGCLPGERARRVAFAVSRTGGVAPATVRLIGQAIAREHCEDAAPAFPAPPAERVGAILNSSAAATRTDVLDGLDGADRTFAQGVRRAIFTFAHLPRRLKAADVPRVLRAVEPRDVARAIAVARQGPPEDAASADFILASLPQRLGDSLRDEMETLGTVKPKDGEAAQAALVSAVRELATVGEIELVEEEDAAA